MDDGMGRLVLAAAALAAAALIGLTILVQGAAATMADDPQSLISQAMFGAGRPGCDLDREGAARLAQQLTGFDAEQKANARIIVRTGQEVGVPWRGWVIAVATALQESSLRNVAHGDNAGPDSRGLFQQRAPWGPLEARMTPATAARMFYLGGDGGQPGLQDIPYLRDRMSVAQAAQAVQRSRYPDAYGQHEEAATALVLTMAADKGEGADDQQLTSDDELISDQCDMGPKAEVVERAIAYAHSQLGQPYLWGGDGPDSGEKGFDCSGLTRAAYQAAGVSLPRTAQQQYDHGPRVSPQQLRPGDLVFFGSGPGDVTHVGLYIGGDRMIDAPHKGAVVRVEDHRWSSLLGATRPTASR